MAEKGEIVSRHVGDIEQQDNTVPLLSMIERMIANPDLDMARVEKLLDLQERTMAVQAKAEFDEAFSHMQAELPVIEERGDAAGRYTYARWEDVMSQIKPVLSKWGFGLHFETSNDDTSVTVVGVLSRGGHERRSTQTMPFDTSGSKASNRLHAQGSSLSYAKRYVAFALLNLTSTRSEDDDGKKGGTKMIDDKQLSVLSAKINEVGADFDKFCKRYGIEALKFLPEQKFDLAMAELRIKQLSEKPKQEAWNEEMGGDDAEE